MNEYDSEGNLVERKTYTYADHVDQIEANTYNAEGVLVEKYIDTYENNEYGRTTEISKYRADGRLAWKLSFKYDIHGNLIETKDYFDDGSFYAKTKYKYEFDETGNWIEKRAYINGKLDEIVVRLIEYYP